MILPKVLCIDEFKGDADGERFQCILVDGEKRKYFKRSKKLFKTHYDKLSDEDKQALEVMFWYSEDLRIVHTLKEEYYRICNIKDKEEFKKEYANWIYTVENSSLKEFKACTTAFHNWFTEIINAFRYNYTNGIIEGLNNKVL